MGIRVWSKDVIGFSGSYAAFNRFRWAVCRAMGGGSWPLLDPYEEIRQGPCLYWCFPGPGYSEETHPGLCAFLSAPDNDWAETNPNVVYKASGLGGSMAGKLAKELEELLPELDKFGLGDGHILGAGGYKEVAKGIIAACKAAATPPISRLEMR